MCRFHKYGQIVRFGPDEVSFINAQSWKNIYQRQPEQLQRHIVPAFRCPYDIFCVAQSAQQSLATTLRCGLPAVSSMPALIHLRFVLLILLALVALLACGRWRWQWHALEGGL